MEDMSILSSEDVASLFGGLIPDTEETKEEQQEETPKENIDNTEKSTDENKSQESGGGNKEEREAPTQSASSPTPNLYSSIAKALVEDGVFPDLDVNTVTDAISLRKAFEQQTDNRLSAIHKRVMKALNNDVEEDVISKYEGTLNRLNSITEQQLKEESTQGENLRKELLMYDYLSKGFSQERAKKEVEKSLNAGSDITDAKEALESLKDYYQKSYDKIQADAEQAKKAENERYNQKVEYYKKTIDEKEKAFNSIPLNKETKEKIFNNILKPVYRDANGEYLTALQKYEREHKEDFVLKVGALFTLTDGFTDFSKLFKPAEAQAVKKGFAELDNVLQGKVTTDDSGNIKLMGNNSGEEYFSGNWKLDL